MNEVIESQSAVAVAQPSAVAIQAATGPMAMAIQAKQAGMSIEEMHGLFKLQKDWEANEARKAYVADMALFKLNPPVIPKDKEVSYNGTQYMHATLGGVTEKIVAALAQHGFSHSWETIQKEDGQIFVTCRLTHRLGHSESTTLNSAPDQSGKKNNIQALASTTTYLSRYTLLMSCGLATNDIVDDDGYGAGDDGQYPTFKSAVTEWIASVNSALSIEELKQIRREANQAFIEAKDLPGFERVKEAAIAKKAELEATFK